MRLRIRHRTFYSYDADVTGSYGIARLTPRELPWQHVLEHRLDVVPTPTDVALGTDHFGNHTTYFQLDDAHTELEVVSHAVVEVGARAHAPQTLRTPWERCRPEQRDDVEGAWEVVDLVLPSDGIAQSARVQQYAAPSFTPGRPLGEAAEDLMHRIHTDFAYEPGTTTVTSGIDDVLDARAGVCQDFAQLLIACLRSHGLAARYVSGYLATEPPPGKERILGADATHAWAAVWLPDGDWLALDPTNDQAVGERYVSVAWGREYADVPPLKGVIFTDASTSTLSVEVDVVRA